MFYLLMFRFQTAAKPSHPLRCSNYEYLKWQPNSRSLERRSIVASTFCIQKMCFVPINEHFLLCIVFVCMDLILQVLSTAFILYINNIKWNWQHWNASMRLNKINKQYRQVLANRQVFVRSIRSQKLPNNHLRCHHSRWQCRYMQK